MKLATLLRREPAQVEPPSPTTPVEAVPSRGARAPLPFLEPEAMSAADAEVVHMASAILLRYPEAEARRQREAVSQAVDELAAPGRAPQVASDLRSFLDAISEWDDMQLAEHYVATFDQRRKCALHLTFYSSGDTRRRGMALVTFTEAFAAAGFDYDADELPDHLPLVLEMSARGGSDVAGLLLASHRQGVELLRSALHSMASPYAHVLDAVCRSLPAVSEDAAERFGELLAAGPPQELVGMESPLLPFPTVRSES